MGKIRQNREVGALKKWKLIANEKGYFKFIFVVALIAFLIYAGLEFAMPYYRYSAFRTDAKELARISVGEAEKTKAQIFERARELSLPLEVRDIEVRKTEKGMRVRTAWSETVYIFGQEAHTFNFKIDIEE